MKYDPDTIINLLIEHEGLELNVYPDSLGIDTIGVGRNLEDRGITDDELSYMGFNSIEAIHLHGITESNARFLLNNDIRTVELELECAHPVIQGIKAVRQMVLVDMGFNLGVPRLNMFKNMWECVENADYGCASAEMLDSKWARQVGRRAERLARMMKTGVFH